MRARHLAVLPLVLALGACGGSDGSTTASPAPSTPAPVSTAPLTTAPATTPAAAKGPGHAKLTFTGEFALTLDRDGAYCNYYYPSERKGVAYSVNATGSEPKFDFTASDDEGNGRAIAYLNTPQGSYAGDQRSGSITLSLDRTKATFDFDVRKVVGRQPVHVKGTITCPAS